MSYFNTGRRDPAGVRLSTELLEDRTVPSLLVLGGGTIVSFNEETGSYIRTFAPTADLPYASNMAFGPDGNVYVCTKPPPNPDMTFRSGPILRYTPDGDPLPSPGNSGAIFIPATQVQYPATDIAFGPDGSLYVLMLDGELLARYSITTRAILDVIATHNTPRTREEAEVDRVYGITISPDGTPYTAIHSLFDPHDIGIYNRVSKYQSGNWSTVARTSRPGVIEIPYDLAFGPDGRIYVAAASPVAASVLRYAPNGEYLGVFADIQSGDLDFGRNGDLYAVDSDAGTVKRYTNLSDPVGHQVPFSLSSFGLGIVGTPFAIALTPESRPDIVMQSARLKAGNQVQFTYETTGNPGPFKIGLYRSADGVNFNHSNRIGDPLDLIPSPMNPQSPGSFTLSTFYVVDPKLPYLIVVADPNNAINERHEFNNVVVVQLATDIKAIGAKTNNSQTIIIEYEVFLSALTQPLEVRIYRSVRDTYNPDTDIAASDVITMAPSTLDLDKIPIGAVGRHRIEVPASLTLSLTPTHRYVVAVLDPLDSIAEYEEQNNAEHFTKRVLGVVTHGLVNPDFLLFGPTRRPSWVDALTSYLKVGRGYDSAFYVDWANASNDRRPNAAVEAGERMAIMIAGEWTYMRTIFPNDIIDIHLIGHSRGSVVISQAVLNLGKNYPAELLTGFVQMTLLDPHPAYNLAGWEAEIDDPFGSYQRYGISHKGHLSVGFFNTGYAIAKLVFPAQTKMDDPVVVIPDFVDASESFFQQTRASAVGGAYGISIEKIVNLWGWVAPVQNKCNLTDAVPGISHTGLVCWYLNYMGLSDSHYCSSSVSQTAVAAGPGGGPHVKVYRSDGSERLGFFAYDLGYTGGVTVAAGDVTGDGVDDIVTGPLAGGGPHIKVFDGLTGQEVRGWMAFHPSFIAGVTVAVGDVNGDGYADIVVGAGPGGGPHVRVFSGLDGSELLSFFAYDPGFRGGVSVAVSLGDIVTGVLSAGAPHVKVFEGMTGDVKRSFWAFGPKNTRGMNVAAGDLNGDGVADYVFGQASGGVVTVLDGASGESRTLRPFESYRGGIRSAVRDVDGDGQAEILTSVAPVGDPFMIDGLVQLGSESRTTGGPRVRAFHANGDDVFDFFAFDPAFLGGVSVG